MKPFEFYNPTRILFGAGKIAELKEYLPPDARILFAFDPEAVHKNGVYTQVKAALAGHVCVEFGRIHPNPDYEMLLEALPLIEAGGLNCIVSAGGGSAIDGSKFIAAAACVEGDPWDLTAGPFLVKKALPHFAIPTLPGAGSEMNRWGVVSRNRLKLKRDFGGDVLFPRLSILDPTTTLTVPWRHLQNGMIDAFSHVVEQYVTTDTDTPLQNRQAEALALTLIDAARVLVKNPTDLAARGHLMWAACLSLNDHLQTGMEPDFAAHRLSHALTALYGLSHGESMALLLPATLEALTGMKEAKLLRYAYYVWHITTGNPEARIQGAVNATRQFFSEIGVSSCAQDHGLKPEMIPEIIAYLEVEYPYPLGECHPVFAGEVAAILDAMFAVGASVA